MWMSQHFCFSMFWSSKFLDTRLWLFQTDMISTCKMWKTLLKLEISHRRSLAGHNEKLPFLIRNSLQFLIYFFPTAYATMYFFYIMIAIISGVNVSAYIAEMYTSKWRFVTYIIAAFPTYALVSTIIHFFGLENRLKGQTFFCYFQVFFRLGHLFNSIFESNIQWNSFVGWFSQSLQFTILFYNSWISKMVGSK